MISGLLQTPAERGRYILIAIAEKATRLHRETGSTVDHVCRLMPDQFWDTLIARRRLPSPGVWEALGYEKPFTVLVKGTRTVPIEGIELEPLEPVAGTEATAR